LLAAGGVRQVHVRDDALVEQEQVTGQALLPSPAAEDHRRQTAVALRPELRYAADVTKAATSLPEELQALAEMRRAGEGRRVPQGLPPISARSGVEQRHDGSAGGAQLLRQEEEERAGAGDDHAALRHQPPYALT
jgi:hypothetical protein